MRVGYRNDGWRKTQGLRSNVPVMGHGAHGVGRDGSRNRSTQQTRDSPKPPQKDARHFKVSLEYDGPIKAPIDKNQKIANLKVFSKDEVVKTIPLFASEKVQKVNFFKSLATSINYLIWGDV